MKTLVVYFSLEGNTDYVANKISEETGATLLRLKPKKAYRDKGFGKYVWGGKSAIMGEAPKLEPYDADLDAYERVIFGFPVWAGTFTPPLRTFIKENQQKLQRKRFVAFACQSGSGAETALRKLSELLQTEFEYNAIFIDPQMKQEEATDHKISEFIEKLK